MKINILLKERKLQLFFLTYILLLIPSLSLIAQNILAGTLIPGIVANFGLLIVIFALSSFMTTKGIRVFYAVLLTLTLVPGVTLLGYLLFAKVLLSDGSITTLFETNVEESKEFIVNYMNLWVTLAIALYIICPVVMIIRMKHIAFHRIKEHKNMFLTCILLLFLFLAIEPVAQHIYFVDFYRIFADYKVRTKWEEKTIETRQSQPFEVTVAENKAPQTMLLVIGESLSRHHMSLYGYERDTNPRLSARKSNLKVYRDVVSPQVHTIPVVRSVLTFADHAHPEYLTQYPSLFELFNRGGYETYLINNQPFGDVTSSYESLLRLADHVFDLSKTNEPDGVVLHTLEQALKDNKRKLIVIHLMGSHAVYKFRYPPSFNYFNCKEQPVPAAESYLTAAAQTIVDQYDNSVRYNDYLIASIIDLLDKQNEPSAMIYFSDHGDEVYDCRDFAGHVYEKVSVYMCEVPFIVWMSGKYMKMRKDLIFHEDRPYSTTDLLFGLSDMAGLNYEGYDNSRSLFTPQFAVRKRFVGDLPYESVIEKTQTYSMTHRNLTKKQ
ncbi:MAG: sulfatase-like hydrolase/transferase [Tannerella sp.]|jgi:heptose-I-phosphate ethanolaminephosphotransferase|nr:sulfatase-like hydrolase/transferase [Tannerella sp.]